MPGLIKQQSEDRIAVRLTSEQAEFKAKHPKLNFSEVVRQQLDSFIRDFNEKEYRRMTE